MIIPDTQMWKGGWGQGAESVSLDTRTKSWGSSPKGKQGGATKSVGAEEAKTPDALLWESNPLEAGAAWEEDPCSPPSQEYNLIIKGNL